MKQHIAIRTRGMKGLGRKPRVRCDFKNELLGFERVRKTVTYYIRSGLWRVPQTKTRVVDTQGEHFYRVLV